MCSQPQCGSASALKPYLRWWLAATSFPPLLWVYRAVYRLLIRWAVRRFTSFPGTRAVYLMRGMTGEEVLPGVSDIDFTVIGEWQEEERHRLMDSYRRLARWIPLYDPILSAHTPQEFASRYQTSHHFQFRFTEGMDSWKLLAGADYLRRLERLPWNRCFGGLHTETKVWWSRFARCVYAPDQGLADRVFDNSLCYKAASEILRVELALAGQPLVSRRQALEEAGRRLDGEAAAYLEKLRRCAGRRHLRYEGPIREDTQKFLLGRLEEMHRRMESHPGLEPAEGVTIGVDSAAEERFRPQPEEALAAGMVEYARRNWAGSYRAAYLASGLGFAMDEALLLLEVDPACLPATAQIRALGRLADQAGSSPRRRVNVFLLLGAGAYQVQVHDLTKTWQALLAPGPNPDVFLALPQVRLDGHATRPLPRLRWTRPVADFIAEERTLFREVLDDPVVYKANTLDFLRMFWKYLQLSAIAASVASGEVVFPQTPPAVRRALARCALPQAPFLERFEAAYRRELQGVPEDIGRHVPAAVSYLKQIPYD